MIKGYFEKRESMMQRRYNKFLFNFRRQTDGAVSIEFAIIIPVFLALFGGIVDFGHAWYMQQVVTNASREGARYGITYQTNTTGSRIAASAKSPTIATVVSNYASGLMPTGANLTTDCNGTGYTGTASGTPLNVTVTATKTWWIVSAFVPGLGSSRNIRVTTTMYTE